MPPTLQDHAQMLCNRIIKNRRRLRPWRRRERVTCYRIYDKDIPELPLAIDDYEGHLHIAEYARPHDREEAAHDAWLQAMCAAVGEALQVPANQVHLKRRQRQRGQRQYERLAEGSDPLVVREGGHRFAVNLSDYLDTGLFLDHRITRKLVADDAAERRMLNLFGYTGAFTIYAGAAGAESTTTVDLNGNYLSRAAENLRLNNLHGNHHRLERADIRQWLDQAMAQGRRYDLVVLDPPTFSNTSRDAATFDLQRDHVGLIQATRALLAPGGVLWFSTNFRGFRPDRAAFAGLDGRETSEETVPPDFRNRRIHRSWRLSPGG